MMSSVMAAPRSAAERVFRVDGFACPGCGGPLALRCVVVNPPATRRILDGLRRATGPPGLDAAGDDIYAQISKMAAERGNCRCFHVDQLGSRAIAAQTQVEAHARATMILETIIETNIL